MKKFMWLAMMLITTSAYASDTAKVKVEAQTDDGTSTVMSSGLISKVFTPGARQQQTLSFAAGTNTSVSIPTDSKGVIFDLGSTHSLHLIGRAGDRGISLDSTFPLVLPISSDNNTTILISNDSGSAQTVKAYFF